MILLLTGRPELFSRVTCSTPLVVVATRATDPARYDLPPGARVVRIDAPRFSAAAACGCDLLLPSDARVHFLSRDASGAGMENVIDFISEVGGRPVALTPSGAREIPAGRIRSARSAAGRRDLLARLTIRLLWPFFRSRLRRGAP